MNGRLFEAIPMAMQPRLRATCFLHHRALAVSTWCIRARSADIIAYYHNCPCRVRDWEMRFDPTDH